MTWSAKAKSFCSQASNLRPRQESAENFCFSFTRLSYALISGSNIKGTLLRRHQRAAPATSRWRKQGIQTALISLKSMNRACMSDSAEKLG